MPSTQRSTTVILSSIFGAFVALVMTTSSALALEVGSTVPAFNINKPGELIIEGDKLNKAPWQSSAIGGGRPALVFYLPARASSEDDIDPLRQRLDKEDYEPGSFHSITVVNLDDALWGTSGFVESQVAKNKRAHPRATMVLDQKGKGRQVLKLPKKTTVVFLANAEGQVIDYREGALTEQAADEVITLLHQQIGHPKAP